MRMLGPSGFPASSEPGRSSRQIGAAAPVGPCHFCGEFGHLKYACRQRVASNPYPLKKECEMHKVICESDRQLGYVSGMSRGVKGSLNKCALYWDRVLEAPQAVLSIIRQGYLAICICPGRENIQQPKFGRDT